MSHFSHLKVHLRFLFTKPTVFETNTICFFLAGSDCLPVLSTDRSMLSSSSIVSEYFFLRAAKGILSSDSESDGDDDGSRLFPEIFTRATSGTLSFDSLSEEDRDLLLLEFPSSAELDEVVSTGNVDFTSIGWVLSGGIVCLLFAAILSSDGPFILPAAINFGRFGEGAGQGHHLCQNMTHWHWLGALVDLKCVGILISHEDHIDLLGFPPPMAIAPPPPLQ